MEEYSQWFPGCPQAGGLTMRNLTLTFLLLLAVTLTAKGKVELITQMRDLYSDKDQKPRDVIAGMLIATC